MAQRVVLIAARNCTTREFRDAFSIADTNTVHEVSGYVWNLTSAWTLNYSTVQQGVSALPGPILFMNTQDGCCWNLWLIRDGKDGLRYHHPFTDLSPLRDRTRLDEEDWQEKHGHIEIEELIEEWEIYGDPLLPVVIDSIRSKTPSEALDYIFNWKGEQLVDALDKFGIPHERSEILAVILGESVTDAELATDVGAFPRFLISLGFGGYFKEWLDNQLRAYEEEREEEDDQYEEFPRFNFTETRKNQLVPVEGGPVPVPFESLHGPARIPYFCDTEIAVGFDVTLSEEIGNDTPLKRGAWHRYDQIDDRAQFSVQDGWILLGEQGKDLLKQLSTLPDHSRLEMATWGDETNAGRHRYSGKIINGAWRIEEAFPVVNAETLDAALSLFDLMSSDNPISVADKEELNAVLDSVKTDDAFGNSQISYDGLHVVCEDWQREEVVKHVFRYRFGDVWDVSYAVELEKQEHEEFQQILEDAVSWIPKIQPSEVLVYKGEMEDFYEVDTSQLSEPFQNRIEEAGQEIKTEGFTFLGNMTAPKTFGEILIHGYVHPTEDVYVTYFIGTLGQSAVDCYTRFDDGSSLTTTSHEAESTIEIQGLYYNNPQVASFKGLLAEHLIGVEQRKKEGIIPAPMERNLIGLAKEIDMFLKRRLS